MEQWSYQNECEHQPQRAASSWHGFASFDHHFAFTCRVFSWDTPLLCKCCSRGHSRMQEYLCGALKWLPFWGKHVLACGVILETAAYPGVFGEVQASAWQGIPRSFFLPAHHEAKATADVFRSDYVSLWFALKASVNIWEHLPNCSSIPRRVVFSCFFCATEKTSKTQRIQDSVLGWKKYVGHLGAT